MCRRLPLAQLWLGLSSFLLLGGCWHGSSWCGAKTVCSRRVWFRVTWWGKVCEQHQECVFMFLRGWHLHYMSQTSGNPCCMALFEQQVLPEIPADSHPGSAHLPSWDPFFLGEERWGTQLWPFFPWAAQEVLIDGFYWACATVALLCCLCLGNRGASINSALHSWCGKVLLC